MTALGPGAIIDRHFHYGLGSMQIPTSGDGTVFSMAPLSARNYTVIGHPGMDWGSSMFQGYIEQLGVSFAFVTNVDGFVIGVGQNTSMTWNENKKFGDELTSDLMEVILKHKTPKDAAEDVKRTRSADQ